MLAEVGVGDAGVSVMTGNPDVGVDPGVWIVGVGARGLGVAVEVGIGAGWEHAAVAKRSSASRRTIRTQEKTKSS